jgi:hypothetical protein
VNVQLWESHDAKRDFGETLAEIDQALKASELYELLAVAAAAPTGQPELIQAFPPVADTLTGVVSSILRKRGDSSLDVFAGFYGSEYEWNCKESFAGRGVEITLNLF